MPSKYTQPPRDNKNAAAAANLPVKAFRLGRIKAAVWENESEQQKFYSVTFARTYVDEANNYHDSDSFGRDDLPLFLSYSLSFRLNANVGNFFAGKHVRRMMIHRSGNPFMQGRHR